MVHKRVRECDERNKRKLTTMEEQLGKLINQKKVSHGNYGNFCSI